MTCAERKDLLLLYAFDQLEPDESRPLLDHVRGGCPRCTGELAAARTIAGQMGLAAVPARPSPRVRARVLAATSPRRTPRWIPIAGTALLAASLTAVAILVPTRHGVDELRRELAAARVVSMAGTGPQPQAAARIFWDEQRGIWHVYLANMKPADPGRTYQLWFITPDQTKVSAGTFDVGRRGAGEIVVRVPPSLGKIAMAAVTEEPAGGVPQPTGAIQLAGKLET
ncbi:MAG TPA: anti-sigma factor [Candidatus Polarisedimenticolaceae bacterium]|nr:anti-sigma factor [Candidatus Polarisedimenticolaceae bacterium]